jgi:hypothetical protein
VVRQEARVQGAGLVQHLSLSCKLTQGPRRTTLILPEGAAASDLRTSCEAPLAEVPRTSHS